jgi:raffinose/stachyose/melibiose transport system permease protein
MNKKNIILVSKACLLLSMLGFCIPVFDEANGFAALIYFLGAGEGALYISIGIALILCFLAMAASILFSSLYFIRGKNENHTKLTAAADWGLMGLIILTLLFSFITVKKFTDEDVEFSTGFYFMVYGMAAHIIVYLYSTLLGENLSTKSEEKRAYWMLSLPAIIFYFGVMTFPSIFSVVLSLTNYSGGSLFEAGALKFVGFKNYMKVFSDQYFYISLKNNFWIVLVSVFGQLPLGFFLAYVLTRGLVKGKDFFQTMIYLPCVISTVVIGILFQTFFSSHGAWTEIMKWINPSYEWTMNSQPMIPVLFVILWMYTGTYLIIFMANLQKIDPQIMEAATIDGATEWQVLWHIIFPELSGVFVISAILAISGSLKSFDLIYVMTGGGPAKQTYVLSLYMFDKAFRGASDYPMANTISTIMVVISLVLIGIVKTLEKKFGAKEE